MKKVKRQPQPASDKASSVMLPEHLLSQTAQNERLISAGRLVTTLCHEITNRVQAARGAVSLASEERGLSEDMVTYLRIFEDEILRVAKLTEYMRYVYHQPSGEHSNINIADLLDEVISLASDELSRQSITLTLDLGADLPIIRGYAGQLFWVLMTILLNFSSAFRMVGGGNIDLRAHEMDPTVQIEYSTEKVVEWFPASMHQSPQIEDILGLSGIQDVINTHGGTSGVLLRNPGITIWLSLPTRAKGIVSTEAP